MQMALETALAHELHANAGRTCGNLSDLAFQGDRYAESLSYLEQALELSQRIGSRSNEWFALSEMSYALTMLGRWDEALARSAEIPEERFGGDVSLASPLSGALEVYLQRGELNEARELMRRFEPLSEAGDVQAEGIYHQATAAVRLAEGNAHDALVEAEHAVTGRATMGMSAQQVKHGVRYALEAALALGDRDKVEELLALVDAVPIGLRPPFLDATAHRFRGRLSIDLDAAERHFAAAAGALLELELPFHRAVVQLEHAERLIAEERADEAEPLLAEPRETFERLRAAPWLARLDAVSPGERAELLA